jgi:Zn-dependent protease
VGFGWAKPVPVNPLAFTKPREGILFVSLAGPVSNILLALVAGIVLRIVWAGAPAGLVGPVETILVSVAMINLYLAFFNLIPIPPFDGSGVVSSLLPPQMGVRYESIGRFGPLLILGLIVVGGFGGVPVIGMIIGPPARLLFRLFTGIGY